MNYSNISQETVLDDGWKWGQKTYLNQIIQTDLWKTDFLFFDFGNFMSHVMNYALSNLL